MASDAHIVQYDANNKRKDEQFPSRLSQEEIRVLKDCNRESFYYRCLPLASAAAAATYFGVKKGFLKGHPKYGPSLKMTGAAVVGWFVGKISYRSICEEKFLHLPNSSIGEVVRKKRGYAPSEFMTESPLYAGDDFSFSKDDSSSLPDPNYNPSYGAYNLDMDKNIQASGLDDRERPTTDTLTDLSIPEEPNRPSISYDELRKRNRQEFEQQFRQQQRPASSSPTTAWDSLPRRRDFDSDGSSRNTYGDWKK